MDNLIGKRIKDFRKAANLTQKQLGERIGVSGAMIGQYETGVRNPKRETVEKISAALGVHITDFYISSFQFVSDNDKYPERDTLGEMIEDMFNDIINRVTPDDLKSVLNNIFDDLDDGGKRELFKKALLLKMRIQHQPKP